MKMLEYLSQEIEIRQGRLDKHRESGTKDLEYIENRIIEMFSQERDRVQANDQEFLAREQAGREEEHADMMASRYYYSQD